MLGDLESDAHTCEVVNILAHVMSILPDKMC